MEKFIAHFHSVIYAVLSGFDRLVFRGHLLPLMHHNGMFFFLEASGIRLLDYKKFVLPITERIKDVSLGAADRRDRPVRYLESSTIDKEALARRLLAEHPIEQGLICIFKVVEPCMTFVYHRSKDPTERGLRLRPGKCLHLYKYFLHPRFGFCSVRLQTWFPFNMQVCLNGREWLASQLVRKGRNDFKRIDNCFTWLGKPELAQRLMNEQLKTDWARALDSLARDINPLHGDIFRAQPMEYYWSAYQTEWATDLIFKSPAALNDIYPRLVRHAMNNFKSPDVMRFLAQKAHGNFTGEIVSSFKDRAEGVRVKHWVRGNSVKMYDKAGSILRVETTIAQTSDFKVFRPVHDNPNGKLEWRPLRKGTADLHRRAEVSQRSNDAYLEALATIEDTTPCSRLFDAVARPVKFKGRSTRALRLGDPDDIALLEAVTRGEFATAGFRNRDIRKLIHPVPQRATERDIRRLSARTSRQLRMLRAHGLVRKIPKTHRYRLTEAGQLLTAALLATRSANIKELLSKAA